MRKILTVLIFLVGILISFPVLAHRSGCHRWHTCPSDTGSYKMEYRVDGKPKQFCGSKMYMGEDERCHYYSTVIPDKSSYYTNNLDFQIPTKTQCFKWIPNSRINQLYRLKYSDLDVIQPGWGGLPAISKREQLKRIEEAGLMGLYDGFLEAGIHRTEIETLYEYHCRPYYKKDADGEITFKESNQNSNDLQANVLQTNKEKPKMPKRYSRQNAQKPLMNKLNKALNEGLAKYGW